MDSISETPIINNKGNVVDFQSQKGTKMKIDNLRKKMESGQRDLQHELDLALTNPDFELDRKTMHDLG